MEDILIIEKIKKMIDEMSSVSQVKIITKYSINAARTMMERKSRNLDLLAKCLPYGIYLQVRIALMRGVK